MAIVTGFTAAAIQAILDGTVESAAVDGSGDLILTLHDASTVNAGSVIGPQGDPGPPGDIGTGSPAGGDLSGTYPNPTVAALAITHGKVAAANKDGVAATPSMRTLGTGATQAAAGDHQHAAADIISGILDIARLPVAGNGEVNPAEVLRSDDSRLPDFASLGLKIKVGVTSVSIVAAASGTAAITFTGTAFTSTPVIVGGMQTASNTYYGEANSPTVSGATARAVHRDGTSTTATVDVAWIAIGV